jgi:peptidoglycan/xylan/chitin deacetylase (PgdA/CDA1 family)
MPSAPRIASLSVDLDEIPCYAAIHGLPIPSDASAVAVYEFAVERLGNVFADEGVEATFFVIGADVERGENVGRLRALAAAGHELGNHSFHHRYDLTRLGRETIRSEIDTATKVIEANTGVKVDGFRAPGYTITDDVFGVLTELGFAYDSSVFPCPAYYGAKTSAIAWIRLRGRKSRSVVDDPRVLFAPADPYNVHTTYWKRGSGLLELPIGVTGDLTGRLPYIGTSVVLSGDTGAKWLTKAAVGRPLVNLELHGIDASDAVDDGLTWLAPHQPDLRKTAREKLSALRTAIRTLRDSGYEFRTLIRASKSFG